jgi:hypothetical protein
MSRCATSRDPAALPASASDRFTPTSAPPSCCRDAAIEDANCWRRKPSAEGAEREHRLPLPNRQKLREYQELVVKSFYIANADVRQTANMIRTMLKTRDIFIDEKVNLLVIKDTPNAVRLAERLIAAQDLAEPEVMLQVEVLEMSSTRLLELGIKFPDSVAWSLVGAAGIPGVVSLPEWLNRGSELVQLRFTDPLFLVSFLQQDGSTNVLANPRIRMKNKEKARIHIGDRVPVITATAAATAARAESVSTSMWDSSSRSSDHLPRGRGRHSGGAESATSRVNSHRGSNTLTCKSARATRPPCCAADGETQILAGLISDQDQHGEPRSASVIFRCSDGSSRTHGTSGRPRSCSLSRRLVRTLARPDALAGVRRRHHVRGSPPAPCPWCCRPNRSRPRPPSRPPRLPAPSRYRSGESSRRNEGARIHADRARHRGGDRGHPRLGGPAAQ